jgi:glycosyltransferase involved in cell wall biosynthesis
MKILQINSVYKYGSTGKIVSDIHNLILANGHESYVAYGRGNHIGKGLIRISNKFDTYIHAIATRLFDKHGLYSNRVTKLFLNTLDKINPDVIHIHNIHGYYLNYKLLFQYFKEKRKKVIWTLHDSWSFTGHCCYYDYNGCDKWKTLCYECPQKNSYPSSYFLDNSEQNYLIKKKLFTSIENLTIVTPSIWLANEVKHSFLKSQNIKVINNGIDLNIFKPLSSDFKDKYNFNNKFLILGVASVWEERKGLKYFLELSKILKIDEQIVLIGLTQNQIDKLPNNILGIIRTLNQVELAQIYSIVDVFVNPTLEDNYPTTNLESLACGTPVITFNSGGSAESVSNDCGSIVEKGNLEDLYTKIKQIRNESDIKIKRCLKDINKTLDKNIKFMEYIKLYEADKGLKI